ncbi:ABC-ATPase domain-containing protein [Halorhodospira neutriphila]|uniref:Isopentenyl-diphosphate delta-isomerase n=1 Tax=Halorhodospira neutriphila TaxID=168379 RepID=A0ABS1E1Y0_9GAMM|nr:ABC-ATPase domain-containing protein [Halorhodospira neutriphila]MBK1725733.1 isopentenyl-diphosphate delta-isomerase [Halorhodospira neutriphila]
MKALQETLQRIDGRGYKAYRDIEGRHEGAGLTLHVDKVQADPFAAPSRLRAVIPWQRAALPEAALRGEPRRRAARDYIARAFRRAARDSQAVQIDAGAQTVLDRSAVLFTDAGVEMRFTVALPAKGRTILGRQAAEILCRRLPEVAAEAATAERLDLAALERHCAAAEDQAALRGQLAGRGLVAFVADGAVLPRRSGVDDRPLADAIPFEAPGSLRVTLDTPNAGAVTGMGVPRGITLIVGGGFHGKSTLLNALELGVYDHVPGDGRDGVVAVDDAVKIRAEDGRTVHAVDLSPFIGELPFGKSTRAFSTELASGSTSQAAALQEALEAGAGTLLVDEDTSATNFMIRDRRMQALVAREAEPITPFVDRIRELRDRLGVSTLLVMGGSGDYLDCADTVIHMHNYAPLDVTERARTVAAEYATGRHEEGREPLDWPSVRALRGDSIRTETKPGKRKLQARGREALVVGKETIDLRAVEQVADASQVRTVGRLLAAAAGAGRLSHPPRWFAGELERPWPELLDRPDGDHARPRALEVMAALNRLRGVRFEA